MFNLTSWARTLRRSLGKWVVYFIAGKKVYYQVL